MDVCVCVSVKLSERAHYVGVQHVCLSVFERDGVAQDTDVLLLIFHLLLQRLQPHVQHVDVGRFLHSD